MRFLATRLGIDQKESKGMPPGVLFDIYELKKRSQGAYEGR